MNRIPCIYGYIQATSEGNRNHHLFQAINHLRRFNQETTTEEIIEEAMTINTYFNKPLTKQEVNTIVKSVFRKAYLSSCKKFSHYCQKCKHGKGKKPFNCLNEYWRVIDNQNIIKPLISRRMNGKEELYVWDILDTSKLSESDALKVKLLREEKGIPVNIDELLKLRGIPIGDEALNEWNKYKEE